MSQPQPLLSPLGASLVASRSNLTRDLESIKGTDAWFKYWREKLKAPLVGKCASEIHRVSNISIAGHTFDGEIYVRIEISVDFDLDPADFDPLLQFSNIVDESLRQDWHEVMENDGEPFIKTIIYSARMRGTFSQHFDLQEYPVDMQSLTFWISSHWDCSVLRFAEHPTTSSTMNNWAWGTIRDEWDIISKSRPLSDKGDGAIPSPEAKITRPVVGCRVGESVPWESALGKVFPKTRFKVKIYRNGYYFLWNVLLPSFVLGCLSFASFVVRPEFLGDRLALSFTILLTVVAFKQSVVEDFPRAAYLTALDRYLFFVFLVVSGNAVANSVVCKIEDADEREDYDDQLFLYLVLSWTIGNIVFLLSHVVRLSRRNDKIQKWLQGRHRSNSARDKVTHWYEDDIADCVEVEPLRKISAGREPSTRNGPPLITPKPFLK